MDRLAKLLADAQQSRAEALELLEQVTAGFTPQDMSRERANEILNGCVEDYGTIIKRLTGRHRG